MRNDRRGPGSLAGKYLFALSISAGLIAHLGEYNALSLRTPFEAFRVTERKIRPENVSPFSRFFFSIFVKMQRDMCNFFFTDIAVFEKATAAHRSVSEYTHI